MRSRPSYLWMIHLSRQMSVYEIRSLIRNEEAEPSYHGSNEDLLSDCNWLRVNMLWFAVVCLWGSRGDRLLFVIVLASMI
jgi:hypothetical protein